MHSTRSFSTTARAIIVLLVAAALLTIYFAMQSSDSSGPVNLSLTENLKDGERVTLSAAPAQMLLGGSMQSVLAYGGSIPGPTFKVQQGSNATLMLTNGLDEDTTLHSHGLRVDPKNDGIPGIGQDPIKPNDDYSYILKFLDPGVYWYHPHMDEPRQQQLGLYGNYIVEPKDPNYWPKVNTEEVLMLSDILLDEGGTIVPFKKPNDHALMGRFGNLLLANGTSTYALSVPQKSIVRFYVTDAANARTFNIVFRGEKGNALMKQVGGDNGRLEHERLVDTMMVSPGERAVVDVLFDTAGTYLLVHTTPEGDTTVGSVTVSDEKAQPDLSAGFTTLRSNTDIHDAIPDIDSYYAKPAQKHLTLGVDFKGMMQNHMQMMGKSGMMETHTAKIEWSDNGQMMSMMNAMATTKEVLWKITDTDSKLSNDKIHWSFKKGDLVKVRIYNDPHTMHPMQHPFHMHGQRFVVLATDGVKNTDLGWKDTVLIGTGETVDILVQMENVGMWMAHCHIAEHLDSGMMFMFDVE